MGLVVGRPCINIVQAKYICVCVHLHLYTLCVLQKQCNTLYMRLCGCTVSLLNGSKQLHLPLFFNSIYLFFQINFQIHTYYSLVLWRYITIQNLKTKYCGLEGRVLVHPLNISIPIRCVFFFFFNHSVI